MIRGRPLRFLAMVLGGWTTLRVAMLWPVAAPLLPGAPGHRAGISTVPFGLSWPRRWAAHLPVAPWPLSSVRRATHSAAFVHRELPPAATSKQGTDEALAFASLVRFGPAIARGEPPARDGAIPAPLRPTPVAAARSRLAGSAWLIARGGADGTLLGGQLGGSQAGARLTYALGSVRRLALSARIASPLSGRGREAALGLDWQPTDAPLHLIAEHRLSLDGGRGGPTLLAVGGIGPTRVAGGLRLEAYAQAGVIARDGIEAFGDGAARLTRSVAVARGVRFDLGAGLWGAGQRGVGRLDIGPTVGAVASLGRQAARLTLDWRERVAGDARPDSGPAVSLGVDF